MRGHHMIPANAIEAAAKALWEPNEHGDEWAGEFETYKDYLRAEATKALEAAAPHIRAMALLDTADALEAQPPMLRAQYVATLRLYAAEPWRPTTCPSECAATNHPGAEHGAEACASIVVEPGTLRCVKCGHAGRIGLDGWGHERKVSK